MERQYKDSGIEWIGKIPETWEVSRLKFVLRSPIETGKRPNEPEGKVISVGGEHIQKGNFDLSHPMYVKESTYFDNKGKIQLHDTLVVKDGATIGKCMYVKSMPHEKMLLNEHVYRISCSKFYYYWILSDIAQKWFRVRNQSTAQESITGPTIMNLPIISLSTSEQLHIADYLDEKCGEIDSLIGLQEQMIEKLKAYKQSVITEAVTKGLDPNAKLVPSGIDWIGEIPEGWETIRIKYLLRERKERSETGEEEPLSMSQKFGLIPTKDMDMIPNMASSFIGAKVVYVSDLVFNKLKAHLGVFSVSKYNGLVSPDYAVYYSTGRAELKYLEYLFKTPQCIGEFRKRSTGVGAGLTRLYTDDLYSIFIPFPPLSEQHSIASYLDEKCADIARLIALKQRKIESLKDYKKSVIFEAVTGKTIIE